MAKIAMIGAGSLVFCQTLTMDILATEALKDSEICLMSRTRPKLDSMEQFIKRVVAQNGLSTKVWSTLDRREALRDADYVIVLGGDGTILSTARALGDNQIPIIGINMGKLGFLAEFSLDEFKDQFEQIVTTQRLTT